MRAARCLAAWLLAGATLGLSPVGAAPDGPAAASRCENCRGPIGALNGTLAGELLLDVGGDRAWVLNGAPAEVTADGGPGGERSWVLNLRSPAPGLSPFTTLAIVNGDLTAFAFGGSDDGPKAWMLNVRIRRY